MNKKKELLVQIMWELAGSIFYAIGIYNFALQAEFPMTGFSRVFRLFCTGCLIFPLVYQRYCLIFRLRYYAANY